MSTDRLAALLHEAFLDAEMGGDGAMWERFAARLRAAGVRVGDDGLDVERLRERLHAEVERLTNGATRPESHQMQERLLRAVDAALDAAIAQGVRVEDPPREDAGLLLIEMRAFASELRRQHGKQYEGWATLIEGWAARLIAQEGGQST